MAEQQTRIPFGDYKPDLAETVNDGLAVAKNTVPVQHGYGPVGSLSLVDGFTAIPGRIRGSVAGIQRDGNPYNFAGTDTTLQALTSERSDVTRATGGAYNCVGEFYWEFAVFGDYVIAVNPADDPQYFDLRENPVLGTSNFQRLGNPGLTNTVAPRAAHVGIIGTFLVLGNVEEEALGLVPNAIHWSALNDPFNWPDPGTSVALAVQSDRQELSGDGGVIQRVVSGAEVAAIFQERAIWRADYRGGDAIFELNRVEPTRGLLIPGLAVPFGRQVFYLAEDGFYLFDYTQSVPIGHEIIDQTFLADVDTAYFDRVSAVPDPDNKRIWVLYPGSGNSAGNPNKFLVYDWGLGRFSHGEFDAEWLTLAVNASLDLDAPGTATDPDDTGDIALGGVDGVGLASFDARQANPGALKLGAYSSTHQLSDFSGAGLAATLETGRRELMPGSRSLATRARVQVDSVAPSVQVRGFKRAHDTAKWTPNSKIDDSGDAPLRKDGRFHQYRVNLPSGFDKALWMDAYYQRSGSR